MPSLKLRLPWPPSVNATHRVFVRGKFGSLILSKKGRDYRKQVVNHLEYLDPAEFPLQGGLHLDIALVPPSRRSIDCDNFLKALLDSLTHAKVWEDDSQVTGLTVTKYLRPPDGDERGYTDIIITEKEITHYA